VGINGAPPFDQKMTPGSFSYEYRAYAVLQDANYNVMGIAKKVEPHFVNNFLLIIWVGCIRCLFWNPVMNIQRIVSPLVLAFLAGILALGIQQVRADIDWDKTVIQQQAEVGQTSAKATFAFTNNGDRSVTIKSIRTSCGCTNAKADKETYQAGESGAVEVLFDFGDRVGNQTKRITVQTDQAEDNIDRLTFRVNILQVLSIQPRMVFWKHGEELTPKTIQLEVKLDEPMIITTVISDHELINATLNVVEEGRLYDLVVTPNADSADANAHIRIVTDLKLHEADEMLEFSAIARILPDLSTDP